MSNEATAVVDNKPAPEAYEVSLPLEARRLRVVKAEDKISSNGNKMINYTLEIFGANPVKNESTSNMVDVNGLQVFGRQMLMQGGTVKFCNFMRNSLGLDSVTDNNIEEVKAAEYVGREGAATCRTVVEEQRNQVTGEIIVNPLNGKPMTRKSIQIGEWCQRD